MKKIILLTLLVVSFVSCRSKNAPTFLGVTVDGYGWQVKNDLKEKGFKIDSEDTDMIIMSGEYIDETVNVYILTGKWGKVLAVNMYIIGYYISDDKYEAFKKNINNEYGCAPVINEEGAPKQIEEYWVIEEGEDITGFAELTTGYTTDSHTVQLDGFGGTKFNHTFTSTRRSSLSYSVKNVSNIKKYKKEK